MAEAKKSKFLMYKGKPLVRKDNVIYYGSTSDKYIIMMEITDTEKLDDLDMAAKVNIELQYTDPSLKPKDRTVKKSQKNGLYSAIDIGSIWLERALNDK